MLLVNCVPLKGMCNDHWFLSQLRIIKEKDNYRTQAGVLTSTWSVKTEVVQMTLNPKFHQ